MEQRKMSKSRRKVSKVLLVQGPRLIGCEIKESELYSPLTPEIIEKRDHVIFELMSTEQVYVRNLNILYTVFKKPMVEALKTKELPISDEQVQLIFSNIDDIINVNTNLLSALVEKGKDWTNDPRIGGAILSLIPFLKLYREYSICYQKANALRLELFEKKEKLKSWLEKQAENTLCQNLSFDSFLILPIQRIPRYRLILEEIIKNTDKIHVDYDKLTTALDKLKEVSDEVDRAIIQQEQSQKMLKVSKKFVDYEMLKPGRTYVHDGELIKVCRKERKKRNFFLFSDILIYAQPPQAKGAKLRVHCDFSLLSLSVKDIPDSKSKRLANAFEIHSEKKSFVVYSETPKEKEEWMKGFQKAIDDCKNKQQALLSEPKDETGALAPVWVPDSEAKTCKRCDVKFTLTNRRHHCRQCGEVVCGTCSSNKRNLKGQGRVRVCGTCTKFPVDWTPSGRLESTMQQESDSDSDIEVIYELEAQHSFTPPSEPTPHAGNKKLAFKKGDMISILVVDDSGWWFGELTSGERGWVPQNYLAV